MHTYLYSFIEKGISQKYSIQLAKMIQYNFDIWFDNNTTKGIVEVYL